MVWTNPVSHHVEQDLVSGASQKHKDSGGGLVKTEGSGQGQLCIFIDLSMLTIKKSGKEVELHLIHVKARREFFHGKHLRGELQIRP